MYFLYNYILFLSLLMLVAFIVSFGRGRDVGGMQQQ